MHDTGLVLCLWKGSCDSLLDSGKSVRADDHDVPDPTVLQCIQDKKPVFPTLIPAYFDCQDFFAAFETNSKYDICCKFLDNSIVADRVVDSINVNDRINLFQRPILPLQHDKLVVLLFLP